MKKFLVTKPRTFGEQKQPLSLREVGFLAITVLAVFGPTALLCVSMGQAWPLFLIAGTDALGATVGAFAYDRVNQPVLSCVPGAIGALPTERRDIIDLKKAA